MQRKRKFVRSGFIRVCFFAITHNRSHVTKALKFEIPKKGRAFKEEVGTGRGESAALLSRNPNNR